jgi:hypothetical protein
MFKPIVSGYVVLVSALMLASPIAHALELTVQAGYEAEYSDNIHDTPNNEDGAWIQTPQVALMANEDGPSVSALVDYNFSRQVYTDNSFSNRSVAEGTARLDWRAIADRLSFELSNTSTQNTIDSRGATIPTNEQVQNTTIAGTTLTMDSFSNHKIDLHYDYEIDTAQETDTDSHRNNVRLSYIVPLSLQRRIQLNGEFSHVNFDSSQWNDYDRKGANLQFANEGDTFEIDTKAGYTILDQEGPAKDVEGTTGNFRIAYHASDTTILSASYARAIEDQTTNNAAGIPALGETFTDNSGVATPYTLDSYRAGVTTQFAHNQFDLSGFYEDQNYDYGGQIPDPTTFQPNQKTRGVDFGVTRAIRPTITGYMYGEYSKVDYEFGTPDQDTYRAGLRLDWNRWRKLSLWFGVDYTKRTSDLSTSEYTEWREYVTLWYTLVGTTPRNRGAPTGGNRSGASRGSY